jgi:hypothetical protein
LRMPYSTPPEKPIYDLLIFWRHPYKIDLSK